MSQPAIVAAGLVAALAAFTSFSIHKIEEGNVVTLCPIIQGCGNTMPELSDLVPFYSRQVQNSIYLC